MKISQPTGNTSSIKTCYRLAINIMEINIMEKVHVMQQNYRRRFGGIWAGVAITLLSLASTPALSSGTGPVTVYQHINFRGNSFSVAEGDFSIRDIRRSDVGNDRISSISIQSGYSVLACRHSRFRGRCETFTNDTSDLRDINFNDTISSFRVELTQPIVGSPVNLYRHVNFRGNSIGVGEGEFSINVLRNSNVGNDQISSISVAAGYSVTACKHGGFRGRCETFTNDASDLRNINFNDVISSFRVDGPTTDEPEPEPVTVVVNDVVGDSLTEAQSALSSFSVSTTPQSSNTVPVDFVISQNPTAGTNLEPGSNVSLVISTGPELIEFPNVVNSLSEAAIDQLINLGFEVLRVDVFNDTIEADRVISQNIAAGTFVNPQDAPIINLEISLGPQPIGVADVVDQPLDDALAALSAFNVTVIEELNASVTGGSVISQTPSAGTPLAQNSDVMLVVSAVVPNVVGLDISVARDRFSVLEGLGFQINETSSADRSEPEGQVVFQTRTGNNSVLLAISLGPQPNRPPVAEDTFFNIPVGDSVFLLSTSQLFSLVSDEDGDALSLRVLPNDVLVQTGEGSFSFDPRPDFTNLPEGETAIVSFEYEVSDGIATNIGTVELRVQGTAPTFGLGEIGPGGGTVFSLTNVLPNGRGTGGLEYAPEFIDSSPITPFPYGCSGIDLDGVSTLLSINDIAMTQSGLQNNLGFIDAIESDIDCRPVAALEAMNYVYNNPFGDLVNDWYLPSIAELDEIHAQIEIGTIVDLSITSTASVTGQQSSLAIQSFWSSTESANATQAWQYISLGDIDNGGPRIENKISANPGILPIRSF